MRISINFYYLICIFYVVSFPAVATQAKAEDIEITEGLSSKNGSATGAPIKLTLKGKTYTDNGWFDQMVDARRPAPDEKFIIDAISKYKTGKFKEVKSQWMPDEQAEFVKSYRDPEQYAKTQSYFRQVSRSKFVAKVFYGHYEIFFVQHEVEGYGSETIPYIIKRINGKFYFTNKLAGDPVYHYLLQRYASFLKAKKNDTL